MDPVAPAVLYSDLWTQCTKLVTFGPSAGMEKWVSAPLAIIKDLFGEYDVALSLLIKIMAEKGQTSDGCWGIAKFFKTKIETSFAVVS